MIPILSFIPTSLLRPLGKLLAVVVVLGATWVAGKHFGARDCVQSVSEASLKMMQKKYEEEERRANIAIKNADKIAKELADLKRKHDNEESIDTGCVATGDVLLRTQALANSTRRQQ